MKIRIIGTPDEIEDALVGLELMLDTRDVSQPHPAPDDPGLVQVELTAIVPGAEAPSDEEAAEFGLSAPEAPSASTAATAAGSERSDDERPATSP